ncbi:amidase, partial [Aureobasidium melanogenum]
MAPDWRQVAAEKRDSVLALIPEEWRIPAPPPAEEQRDVTGKFIQQYLDPREIEITETEATEIVNKTSSGQWTAVEVTKAFCHRSAVAHQLVNCLHEIFFEAAIESAQKLDHYFANHKKPIGPLHGLPVSLKDQFHVKGVETHMGYVGWIGTFQGEKGTGKEKVFESEMVKELRSLGAVLYVKTAVPHTLMCGETTNNIIDYCWNPTNRNLSSGGSSGGEGALISLKGSPLGWGTDIGGSIRIPAAFNGLFGLRPSAGRLPYEGMANSFDGAPSILSVVGPLSSSSAGVKLAVQSILQTEPWLHDPRVHPIPWRTEQEETAKKLAQEKKLTFAVFKHDGLCAPHPPIKRALEETVQKLQGLGHKVIEWQPPSHEKLQDICAKSWNYDGGA